MADRLIMDMNPELQFALFDFVVFSAVKLYDKNISILLHLAQTEAHFSGTWPLATSVYLLVVVTVSEHVHFAEMLSR